MKFSLVEYISEDILPKFNFITSISDEIKKFLNDKEYGDGIAVIYIGVVCVNPIFKQFFPAKEKYTKSKKMIEYSLILDFEDFKNSKEKESIKILTKRILVSIDEINEKFNVNRFNMVSLKEDLKQLFIKKEWIDD